MAKETFRVSIITPGRAVLEADATFVAFPAHDGEVGVLVHHAPFLYKLGKGKLRAEVPGHTHRYTVNGGFAQMVESRLSILTEQANAAEA